MMRYGTTAAWTITPNTTTLTGCTSRRTDNYETPLMAFHNKKASDEIGNNNPQWMEADIHTDYQIKRRHDFWILQSTGAKKALFHLGELEYPLFENEIYMHSPEPRCVLETYTLIL